MEGLGYAAGWEKGGLLSGRAGLCCWAGEGWTVEWYAAGRERGGLLSGRAGLCCWAVERWIAEWEGAMFLGGREVDC